MPAVFEIRLTKNEQYYFNLRAANGEVILTSQMYKSKASARHGIESVKKNGPNVLRYDFRKDKQGEFYFVLKAGNNQIIGTSEPYPTFRVMETGVKSVIKNSAAAQVKDVSV